MEKCKNSDACERNSAKKRERKTTNVKNDLLFFLCVLFYLPTNMSKDLKESEQYCISY